MNEIARSPENQPSESTSGWTPVRHHVLPWAVLCIAGALLFADSYLRWGHPIIDLGRDLYLPTQILRGRVLYQELLYNYGPTFPYMMAGVITVFGDGLAVFEAVGLIIGVLATIAIYAVGNRLGGRIAGFGSALMFLVFSFFANSTWGCNFVLPYAFAATLGTAFALWSLHFLLKYLYDGRSRSSLILSVALMFATVFTKHEIGLAIALVHAVSWWAQRVPLKTICKIAGLGIVLVILFVAVFAADDPGDHTLLAENILRYMAYGKYFFFQKIAGLDEPGENIVLTAKAAALLAAITLSASLAGAAFSARRKRRPVLIPAGIAAILLCAWLIWKCADVTIFKASLPLAFVAVIFYAIKDRRDPLLPLSLFVLLSAIRIPLRFYPVWFGFYLFVPAFPFVIHLLGQRLAPRLPGRRAVICALAALAVVVMVRFEISTLRANRSMTSIMITPKGAIRDYPVGRAEAIEEFIGYVEERFSGAKPSMVVFPEGVSLNYFTGMQNPTAYCLFIPPQVNSTALEERIIEELTATRPQYIVFTSRSTHEFGMRGFGIDYGRHIFAWINSAYSVERVFRGPEGTHWRLTLMRRRIGR